MVPQSPGRLAHQRGWGWDNETQGREFVTRQLCAPPPHLAQLPACTPTKQGSLHLLAPGPAWPWSVSSLPWKRGHQACRARRRQSAMFRECPSAGARSPRQSIPHGRSVCATEGSADGVRPVLLAPPGSAEANPRRCLPPSSQPLSQPFCAARAPRPPPA